jgi:peroxiredoxin
MLTDFAGKAAGCFLILIVASFSMTIATAQHYEQTLKKCVKNFHEGLGDFTKERASAEVERRYEVLNECIKGQKFPSFKLNTYTREKYSSEQSANKVVLLNFWITKSPTAVAAISYLNELVDEYKDQDLVILSFSSEEISVLAEFIKTNPIQYRVFGKSRELINHQFTTLLGYPTNIILNRKGEVVKYKVGGGLKSDELKKEKEVLKRVIDSELASK